MKHSTAFGVGVGGGGVGVAVLAALGVLGVLAGGALLAGCGGGSSSRDPGTALTSEDFSEPGSAHATANVAEIPAAAPVPGAGSSGRSYPVERTGPIAERGGPFDVVASAGEPIPASDARQIEKPVLVDAKVGDINGRPVFISDFFASMDARLRTEARTAPSLEAFGTKAVEQITRKMRDIINDELLQAEARASLTPEEKQGFRYWIQTLQDDFLSRNYRSQALAEQKLADAGEDGSLEKWRRDREERELVLYQVRQQIIRNIHVPFIEVENYYNRRYDEFNPPPLRQFRMISIDAKDTAGIEGIKTELASGVSFEEIAKRPNNLFRAKEGGLYIPEAFKPKEGDQPGGVKPEDPEKPAAAARPVYFNVPALNEAAISLAAGAWTGPIENGSTMAFLRFEEISLPRTSLYEAQAAIEQRLRSQKIEQRMNKYIMDLLKRASVDDIDQMVQRLVDAALERYWFAERGAGQAPVEAR